MFIEIVITCTSDCEDTLSAFIMTISRDSTRYQETEAYPVPQDINFQVRHLKVDGLSRY